MTKKAMPGFRRKLIKQHSGIFDHKGTGLPYQPLVISVGAAGCAAVQRLKEKHCGAMACICIDAGEYWLRGTGKEQDVNGNTVYVATGNDSDMSALENCLRDITHTINAYPVVIVSDLGERTEAGLIRRAVESARSVIKNYFGLFCMATVPCDFNDRESLRRACAQSRKFKELTGADVEMAASRDAVDGAVVFPADSPAASAEILARSANLIIHLTKPIFVSLDCTDLIEFCRICDGLSFLCQSPPCGEEDRARKAIDAVLGELHMQRLRQACGEPCKALLISLASNGTLGMEEYSMAIVQIRQAVTHENKEEPYTVAALPEEDSSLEDKIRVTLFAGGFVPA